MHEVTVEEARKWEQGMGGDCRFREPRGLTVETVSGAVSLSLLLMRAENPGAIYIQPEQTPRWQSTAGKSMVLVGPETCWSD